jgi:hypothetical protein
MDTEVTGTLSETEKAYFDSRGEAEIKAEPTIVEETTQPDTVEPVDDGATDAELADVDALDETVEPEKQTGQSKVPLAALTKTRAEMKAERDKRIETEKQNAVLMDRLQRIVEAQQQPEQAKQQVAEIPDPAVDPQGAIEWATNQIKAQQEAQKQYEKQTAEQQQAQAEWQQIYTAVATDYEQAVAADPSVKAAHEYLLNSQGEELMAMGLSKEEAQAEITRIEQAHIRFAKQRGVPIGEYLVNLAKPRGWRPQAQPTPTADPNAALDKLAAAVDGSTSLSNANGGAPQVMNAEAIANMSPEQFEAWLNKNGSNKFRKLAGG